MLSLVLVKGTNPLTDEEIEHLVKCEELAYLANQRLLQGVLSWSDYLECLEIANVNIDDYLVICDDNAKELGF
jgi:hypothetical protein